MTVLAPEMADMVCAHISFFGERTKPILQSDYIAKIEEVRSTVGRAQNNLREKKIRK
jgi:hypothetical protein